MLAWVSTGRRTRLPTHALLFVDQVDSTRQLAQIGDDAMVAVRLRLQDLLTSSVEGHHGRVFGNNGANTVDRG